MTIVVFHNAKFLDWAFVFDSPPIPKKEDLTRVAKVDTNIFEVAFKQTQHIERSWICNPLIMDYRFGNMRSTSVGDVLFNVETNVYLLVMPFGFKNIENLNIDYTKLDSTPLRQ